MPERADHRDRPRVLIGCYFPRKLALEGVGTFVRGVAASMARQGWPVQLVWPVGSQNGNGSLSHIEYRPGPGGVWRYLAALGRASRDSDLVLLIENNPTLAGLASFSRSRGSTFSYFYTPLQSLRTLYEMGWSPQAFAHTAAKHHWLGKCQRWSNRRCIVASRFQADQLKRFGAHEVHVLPGGGLSRNAPAPTRADARRELGWDDRQVVGYLGHFSPAKGVDVLVEAFARQREPAVLALAHSGTRSLSGESQQILAPLRSAGRVRELGVVSSLAFLAACDLVVLPFVTSSVHHLPLVMLESFAAATPVITTRVGGVHELIETAGAGEVAEPRDPDGLAGLIDRALRDPEACREMGRNARALFERELADEVFCSRLSQIVQEAPT